MKPVPITCPHCGRVNDMHAEPGLAAPTHGDLGVCWECHEPFRFELIGRALDPEERAAVENDDDFRSTLHAMVESTTPSEASAMRRRPDEN